MRAYLSVAAFYLCLLAIYERLNAQRLVPYWFGADPPPQRGAIAGEPFAMGLLAAVALGLGATFLNSQKSVTSGMIS